MTTIAANKTEMCGDLQYTVNQAIKFKGTPKIFKIKGHELHHPEDFIIGFCGAASDFIDVVDYYYNPESYKKIPNPKSVSGIVLTLTGRLYMFDTPGVWLAVQQPFVSVGSGASVALGALHTGASPKEAILAASKVDPFTGMGTTVMKI
jgi:20S proteasome alpha/beta subunit